MIFALSGIIFGLVLGFLCKEELKIARRYILWVHAFLLTLLILILAVSFHFYIAFLGFSFFFLPLRYRVIVSFLGVAVFVRVENTIGLFSVLLFLFGLPTGLLLHDQK